MNYVNLGLKLRRLIPLARLAAEPDLNERMTLAVERWPLLTYSFGDDSATATRLASAHLDAAEYGHIWALPFTTFRFAFSIRGQNFFGAVESVGQSLAYIALTGGALSDMAVCIRGSAQHSSKPGQYEYRAKFFDAENGRQFDMDKTYAPLMDEAKRFMLMFWVGLQALCAEYTAPGNHVASIRPGVIGKSVEWVQSRTHYTVIHRRHAANRADITLGSTVREDASVNLKRCAHMRRAHERVLRAPRYYKDGKTPVGSRKLKINSIWVGPPEWRDASGQVYRIATGVKKTA